MPVQPPLRLCTSRSRGSSLALSILYYLVYTAASEYSRTATPNSKMQHPPPVRWCCYSVSSASRLRATASLRQ